MIGPLNRKKPGMNKTEPVRGRDEVRDFRSYRVPKFDTVGLTNSGSFANTTSTLTLVRNFQSSELANSGTAVLQDSATSELSKAVRS
jgi:hypothetical protein